MEFLYTLLSFMIIAVIIVGVIGLIKPSLYKKYLRKFASRKYIVLGTLALVIILAIGVTVFEPASVKQARLDKERAAQQAKQLEEQKAKEEEEAKNKESTKEVTETQSVDFVSETKDDNTLAKGQTKVVQEGQKGEKKVTYTVKYKGDTEISRTVKSEEVTKEPVNQVTANGTYVAPAVAPATTAPSTGSGGRTGAICRDGTKSSATGSGACSHHGGVAQWLY